MIGATAKSFVHTCNALKLKDFHTRHLYYIQSTLGFETLDKAAALDLETATPLTDLRQYINSNLGFRNLNPLDGPPSVHK